MKKKIEAFIGRLHIAVRHNPVEVILAALFCCFGCALYETNNTRLMAVVPYFPAFFLITYSLNSLTEGKRWRFAYYLSLLFFIPFFWREKDVWFVIGDVITRDLSGKGFVISGPCARRDY